MINLENKIYIHRGEQFVFKHDGFWDTEKLQPLVIEKSMLPFICFSMRNQPFEETGAVGRRYWIDLSHFPKFTDTSVYFHSNTVTPGVPDQVGPTVDAVHYILDSAGNREYWYWTPIVVDPPDPNSGTWSRYDPSFGRVFSTGDTSEWTEMEYYYDLALMSGSNIFPTLLQAVNPLASQLAELGIDINHIVDLPDLIDAIKRVRPELLDGVDIESPIIRITFNQIFQEPNKIVVRSRI